MKQRQRRITLQNLLSDGAEIWVENKSGEITGREAGNIVLQVGQGNAIDVVIVPPGDDPVCLTDQVTPKLLAECMDLFKLVRSGALHLLDPAQADEYYEQNQTRKKIVEDKIEKLLRTTPEQAALPQAATSANVQINAKVGDICLKAKHAAISEREALERLMEQSSVLKLDDYNYLMMNGVFGGIKKWAKDQSDKLLNIADMTEQTSDPVENAISKD